MDLQNHELTDFIMLPGWEGAQDKLASIFEVALVTVRPDGSPVTRHSRCTDFCKLVRANPVSRVECLECFKRLAAEAARLEQPSIELCHCGIAEIALPLMSGGRCIGAVIFGQVLVSKCWAEENLERLINRISPFPSQDDPARRVLFSDLFELYDRIPVMDHSRIAQLSDKLTAILSASQVETAFEEQLPQQAADMSGPALPVNMSSPVYPALVYIEDHLEQSITLRELARLCNTNSTNFSRMFTRDVGEGFRDYVKRRKVALAREMLCGTELSIAQIAASLSFASTGAFIKAFKKFEGVAPWAYRQQT